MRSSYCALNINGLLTRIDELKVFVSFSNVDILQINESKLDPTVHNDEVYIPGFEIVRNDLGMEVVYVHTYALI